MATDSLTKEFAAVVGENNLFCHEADLYTYSYDAAVLTPVLPALAVRPKSKEDLGKVVWLCHEHGLPITVRGAGTNLSGGAIPARGGVVILTNGLNRILEINTTDLYAVVEPGVVTAHLATEAAKKRLFYPPDPGSQAVSTLGGNVAENAGGLRGLKYGVTRDYVMALDFFSSQGDLVMSGSKTVKCVTGYNLPGLMVGSEGTLGIVAEITLKLIPPPKAARSMLAVFDQVEAASQAVAQIIAAHIIPATLEFMDNSTIRAVEAYCGVGLPVEAAAVLLIEVDGHPAQVEEQAAEVENICAGQGSAAVEVARDSAQRDRIWEGRRAALSALAKLRPTLVLEDATVPRSQIPAMVSAVERIARRMNLTIGIFGHAGDGNLHPTILCDKRDQQEWRRVEAAVEAIFHEALALKGTLTGEHGIGLAKSRFMALETNQATLSWSRALKRALDPKGILNPGKLLDGEA